MSFENDEEKKLNSEVLNTFFDIFIIIFGKGGHFF